jgi:tetratricopeptide (TPR) repeat protein
VYSYLQKGENDSAKKVLDDVKNIKEVQPVNFKVAYAFASVPSRYLLENKLWKEAAGLKLHSDFPWQKFPWQEAIVHFAKGLGYIHTGNTVGAKTELQKLTRLYDTLVAQNDAYKANQVLIQMKSLEGWINFKKGNKEATLQLMNEAADLEDKTEKHPVTPCEVIPARELLGDMLMEMKLWKDALVAYESDLKKHPNRFNGLCGAAKAAEKLNDRQHAEQYYKQLLSFAGNSSRSEVTGAYSYVMSDQ